MITSKAELAMGPLGLQVFLLQPAARRGRVPSMSGTREVFGGPWYGIWNVEGDNGEPLALFPWEEEAYRELRRRRALPEDDEDRLSEFHHVFPCDIAGAWWNSYEPDPRADSPLTADEIAHLHGTAS